MLGFHSFRSTATASLNSVAKGRETTGRDGVIFYLLQTLQLSVTLSTHSKCYLVYPPASFNKDFKRLAEG